MTYVRPQLTTKAVRCRNCGEQYPENECILRHAGCAGGRDFYNTECPYCYAYDTMSEKYAAMSDAEFRAEQHAVARLRQRAMR